MLRAMKRVSRISLRGSSPFDEFTGDDYLRATTQEYQGLADSIAEAANEEVEMQAVAAAMPGIDSGLVGFDDVTGEEPSIGRPRGPRSFRSDVAHRHRFGAGRGADRRVGSGKGLDLVVRARSHDRGSWRVLCDRPAAGIRSDQPLRVAWWAGCFRGCLSGGGQYAVGDSRRIGMTLVATTFWYAVVPRRNPLANASLTVFGMAWVAGLMAFAVPIIMAPRYQELIVGSGAGHRAL